MIEFAPVNLPKSIIVFGDIDYFDDIFKQLQSLNKKRKTIKFHSIIMKNKKSEF